jgi:aryl carrier-like protein
VSAPNKAIAAGLGDAIRIMLLLHEFARRPVQINLAGR